MRQEILNVSQIAVTVHGIRTPFFIQTWLQRYRRCPFILRTALTAIPLVSDLCDVDVQRFQEKYSQALPNSNEVSVYMTFGCLLGSKNFCKFFCVSWDVFVLHWYDCIHCVAKSCTTTAYRWLFRDSHPSLRDSVIRRYEITKNFRSGHDCTGASSARSPCHFGFQADLAISVLREVNKDAVLTPNPVPLLLATPLVSHGKNLEASRYSGNLSSTRFSLNSPSHSGRPREESPRASSLSSFLFGFSVPAGPCDEFPPIPHSYYHFLLMRDEDVGDVGEEELEELVDRPGTTKGT